ncbi:MAG: phosphotransferase, partial [Pseudomonadota bacterium]
LKRAFTAKTETMCHGDLHAGSIMATPHEARIIDPEFAFYGPFGFDIGMLIGNYLMAYHAASAHLDDAEACASYQGWILQTIEETWATFSAEFAHLWRNERNGILYARTLYEDQGNTLAAETALEQLLAEIFEDAIGFAGIEMHRRILGLAHVAELDTIEHEDTRAVLEERCLRLGRMLVVNRRGIGGMDRVIAMARMMETGG